VLGGVLITVLSAQAQRIVPPPASPRPSSGGPGTRDTGPPLTIVSERALNVDELGNWSFPVPRVLTASQLQKVNSIFLAGPTSPRVAGYFNALGGYAIGTMQTQVVVQNNRSHPIRIIDMHVVKSCHAPVTGTLFYAPGQAQDTIIGLGFNLDSPDTGARIVRNLTMSRTADYFDRYTISIKPGAQQVFRFQTTTTRYACSFRYQATILDGEKKVYQLIGDGRQPFRLSVLAVAPAPNYFSRYSVMYVGGMGSPAPDHGFARVSPKTYH
jgi:hypothetical protein